MSDDDKFPSDAADRFQVRMPPGLRDRIAAEARASNRSMNAEIVARLQSSLDGPKFPAGDSVLERYAAAVAKLAAEEAVAGVMNSFKQAGRGLLLAKSGAWQEGEEDFDRYGLNGRGRNPYPPGSPEHSDWNAGFDRLLQLQGKGSDNSDPWPSAKRYDDLDDDIPS